MSKLKTIALVEWNWKGHHPAEFNRFVLALEDAGANVLALCANPAEAEATANATRPAAGTGTGPRGKTVFARVRCANRRFFKLRPHRISMIDWAIRHFRGIEAQACGLAGEVGQKVDAIFYACVYDFDFEWVRYAQPFLRLPWAGLYLHALSYRMRGQPNPYSGRLPCPEKMFSTRLCKGIFILDEEIVDQVSRSIGKPVVVLPDVDDMRMPVRENERALGDRLAAFAAGRPVVGLFGHLQKSKGLMVFLEAARKLAEVPVCFALGGEMDWPAEEGEKRQICRILAECPHAWTHLLRIPEETQMNYLLSKCDVLYAGYMDFPHSSGIMSKAAALRKPLIVSDGYLMANRARRFKLGEIIPQGNVAALVDAIQKLAQDTGAWKAANHPRWNEYCEEHAFARFKAGVQNLLNFV